MDNNARIIKQIQGTLKMVREQLDAEDRIPFNSTLDKDLVMDIAHRIDIGAEKYGKQVPITEDDGRVFTREAYEELCDALVYLSSVRLAWLEKAQSEEEGMRAHRFGQILFNIALQTILFMEEYYEKEKI